MRPALHLYLPNVSLQPTSAYDWYAVKHNVILLDSWSNRIGYLILGR